MPETKQVARTAALARVPLFNELAEEELRFLSDRAVARHYAPGELIFSEGESCTGLYIVESGQVRIFKTSPSGREQVLGSEGPGASIAELPVFDGGTYPASSSAITETTLLFVSKKDFHALCIEHPDVALKVLRVVGKRLRRLVGIIEELSFTTVRHRLIASLIRLAQRDGKKTPRGIILTLPNNQELAAQIGTVRELISRNLSRLQAEGTIQLDGKLVLIPKLDALQEELERAQ